MNKRIAQFAFPVLMFAFAGTVQAAQQEITFGQWGDSFFGTKPNEVYYIDSTLPEYNPSGFKNVAEAASTQWIATNWRENSPASFESASVFNLDSMWLAGAWGGQTLTITGYVNGVWKYSEKVDITTAAEQYFFTGFLGIDRFTIEIGDVLVPDPQMPNSGMNWALASVTVTVVPEPEAYAMLLAGLGLMGVMVRRRQRS